MNKLKCVIYAPIDTYSGYGANARDKVKAIIELYQDKWEIGIISCRWGGTPQGFIHNHLQDWGFLNNYIFPQGHQLSSQPDIMIWITIPSEFQPIGKYNIGITAGIETTMCSGAFLEGINRMNINIVSSEHAKKVFQDTKYNKVNKQTNQPEGTLELTKPVEVCFEGFNENIYRHLDVCSINFLDEVKEDFAFLFAGHWIGENAPIGEDRKNISLLIKAFYETFKNKKDKPALVLKTAMVNSSYIDRDEILKRIAAIKKTVASKDLPNIYLLHGDFSDAEMNEIYNHNKIKAMVSLTHGEGFGRPLLEFSLSKKPLLATGWSGQLDFLKEEFTTLLKGELTQVHPAVANDWLLKEAKWFTPNAGQVGFYLKDMFENYSNYTDGGKRQAYFSKNNFSWLKMKDRLKEILDKNIPEFPKQVQLVLPKLKKIELPKLSKVNEG